MQSEAKHRVLTWIPLNHTSKPHEAHVMPTVSVWSACHASGR